MESPDTTVYELESQITLSCFRHGSSLCKCFQRQKKKSRISVTLPENAQESAIHYSDTIQKLQKLRRLHITVFGEITEYKTMNVFFPTFYLQF